jgi:copper chaperone CopZ
MTTTSFRIAKLHCESCIKFCTLKFKKLPGVSAVSIDPVSGAAKVEAKEPITLEQLQAALAGTDYQILPAAAAPSDAEAKAA